MCAEQQPYTLYHALFIEEHAVCVVQHGLRKHHQRFATRRRHHLAHLPDVARLKSAFDEGSTFKVFVLARGPVLRGGAEGVTIVKEGAWRESNTSRP